MQQTKFSTIKYQPYANRSEHVNIGIIVWHEKTTPRIHLIPNLRKVKAIHPEARIDVIRGWETEIPEMLNSFEIFSTEKRIDFVRTFFSIDLSEHLGMISYEDEEQYLSKVSMMLSSIAQPAGRQPTRSSNVSKLSNDLKKTFNIYGWLGNSQADINNHLIVPRYEISHDEAVTADFALKNGLLHIVEVIDMRGSLTSNKKTEVRSKALVYDFAKQLEQQQSKGYSIIAGALYEEQTKPMVKLLERYSDQVLHWENQSDMSFFMESMATATGKPMLEIPIH